MRFGIFQRTTLALLTCCLSAIAASPKIEKALTDLTSPDIQVRRDALDEIAYSEDPRIPYLCLPLLKDPGSSTRMLAARAIGSRFQFVKQTDVPKFVEALERCWKEGAQDGPQSYTAFNCQRAIGLLTLDYNFPDVFGVSPDKKWAVYERHGSPVTIEIESATHRMLPFHNFLGPIRTDQYHWSPNSLCFGMVLNRYQRTDNLCFYRVVDQKTWQFTPDEVEKQFQKWIALPHNDVWRPTLEFVRWREEEAHVKLFATV
jgi:hypothetical protein